MAKLPLCVIGGGQIGGRHIEVSLASPFVELTAVVEPFNARREELAAQGLPVVADLDAVPTHTRAAIIATPTQDHAVSGMAVLDKGWAVIVEKPVAGTLDEARALVAKADALGIPLFTGHHRRCHPFSVAARDEIAKLGDLVGVQGLWSLRKHNIYYDVDWRRQPGAGPLLTNLTHELDLLRFMLGDITEVSAMLSSERRGFVIEDTSAIALRFGNGALGSFLISDAGASPWSFEAASNENPVIAASGQDYIRITGTDGALEFPSLIRWHNAQGGETEWGKPLTALPARRFDKVDPLMEQVNRFAKVILDGVEDDILSTGADGIASLEMTLATALSGRTGKPVAQGGVAGDFNGT